MTSKVRLKQMNLQMYIQFHPELMLDQYFVCWSDAVQLGIIKLPPSLFVSLPAVSHSALLPLALFSFHSVSWTELQVCKTKARHQQLFLLVYGVFQDVCVCVTVCFLLLTDTQCVWVYLQLVLANCLGPVALPLAFPSWMRRKGQPQPVRQKRD